MKSSDKNKTSDKNTLEFYHKRKLESFNKDDKQLEKLMKKLKRFVEVLI